MILSQSFLWRKLREYKILAQHRRVAHICENLIGQYRAEGISFDIRAKKQFESGKIIWQYWAQGYVDIPETVRKCLESVDRFAGDYQVIRLSDDNLEEYLDIPDFIEKKRGCYSRAHFADLLRLMLLSAYGGIWMDATLFLSGPIPVQYAGCDFFVFRRDPAEPNIRYWRNTYAYYFGWAKGFRVNMLNSFIVAKKGNGTIKDLTNLMLLWWQRHDALPDYFFFQILFDVYNCKENLPLVSDTLPHYLQQSINDPGFNLSDKRAILRLFPIHKLTYKLQ